ncbi:MAG: TrbI/VirB10 family protein [Gammaproteobacteria bacterium]
MAKQTKGIQQPQKWGRTRIIILLIAFAILLVGALMAFFAIKKRGEEQEITQVSLKSAPRSIRSIPGEGGLTPEQEQNIRLINQQKAQQAARTGGTAIPILTQTGQRVTTTEFGPGEAGPEALIPGCNPKELALARKAGVRVDELRCKGCSASQLNAAGYSAGELVQAGYTAKDLKDAGYTADQLKEAGLTAKNLYLDAGFGLSELKIAGYSAADLKNAGITDVKALRAAGYTPADLRDAGFSSTELTAAGATLEDLKNAGYSASELKKAGFSAADLAQANYQPDEIVGAGYSDDQLAQAGITSTQIKEAKARLAASNKLLSSCNSTAMAQARSQGMTALEMKERFNCPPAAFKKAGFTAAELKRAGFKAKDLKNAGYSALELRNGGWTAKELKDLGFNSAELKAAGFTPGDLFRAGFTAAELAKAPFDATELHDAGLSVEELKAAGFTADSLKKAGYSDGDLIRGGFTPVEVAQASAEMANALKAGAAVTASAAVEPVMTPPTTTLPGPTGKAPASAPQEVGYPQNRAPTSEITVPTQKEAAPVVIHHRTTEEQPSGFAVLNAPLPPQEARAEEAFRRLQTRQAKQMTMQQKEEVLRQIQASMQSQASDLFSTWNPPATQMFVRGESATTGAGGTGSQTPGGTGPGGTPLGPPGQPPVGPTNDANVIKAGTILFGVLDTGINSDEQSPILATIVQEGPLKKGRLLGQFSRVDKKVLISFNTLSLPTLNRSISVNIVAIDPNTARTAVATNVDNHYMLRYGSLFASSFLQGLAEAVASSGSTTIFDLTGGSSTQNPTFSPVDKTIVALGNVGTQYAATMSQNFQKPPTVKVDAGAGIGLLLMSDLNIPKS